MKIINRIETNYFRSVYSVDLKRIEDFNILIGNNDSGKSNILKSLNLFFNNETELGQPFYFPDDLTRKREKEVRDSKGRATIWMKIYFNNFLGWKSLPQEFVIKKVWNRYAEYPETIYPSNISNATMIAKFMNKLSFHYIPAIRGRDIFAYFLTMLHDALLDDEKAGLLLSTDNLIKAINDSTQEMSNKIQTGVGIRSSIQPPTDLRVLFNALDFSTNYNSHSVPLQKRGDGVQSRHIPFILDFIARHSDKYHIWAYEEPETSLELGAAFVLANQFKTEFCIDNQIFITTHSPAFYDLSGENISKWYVYQDDNNDGTETRVHAVSSDDILDQRLGVAALIAERAREAFEQVEQLNKERIRLDIELEKNKIPHIIVEGITDKIILEAALFKLYPNEEPFCEFIDAGGANNIPPYLKSRKVLSQSVPNTIIGLFDHDREGKNQIKEFKDSMSIEGTGFIKISSDKSLYVGLLPIPNDIQELNESNNSVLPDGFPVPIEFMFPFHIINQAISEEILILEDRVSKASEWELSAEINLTKYYEEKLPKEYAFIAKKVKKDSKKDFADWIKNKNEEVFKNFRPLFEQIKQIVT
ncbi:ATP-dependent endonuclease [Neisseria sp.]|uniref:ATP-dependent nuclease n=1 Tax=Neisseria sp. TaxID=192066 RepID=UPI0026DB0A23|nr:AAA family ATPase [Neisseria sp.]MDO4227346.1 AAA family ATPase [Neisseria sp.]